MKAFIPLLFLVSCNTPGPAPSLDLSDIPLTSFEACLIKGGPIMESHPRQCAIGDQHFTEDITTGKISDRRNIFFEVGPQMTDCMGVGPMRCMIVNGGLFYDGIDGFSHKPGTTSIIEVEREQYCDPDVFNSCPQDVGIYRYNYIRTISER